MIVHTSDLWFLVGPSCMSVLSVSPEGSGRASLSGDIITLQWLESGAGFSVTILSDVSMLGRGLGNDLHHWLHSAIIMVGEIESYMYLNQFTRDL